MKAVEAMYSKSFIESSASANQQPNRRERKFYRQIRQRFLGKQKINVLEFSADSVKVR